MSNNMVNYSWQRRTDRRQTMEGLFSKYNHDKTARKLLSKKLNAIQTHPNRWIHEMDAEMLESVDMMLKSENVTDRNMAKDIVFKSKLSYGQIRFLVSNHCYVLLTDETADYLQHVKSGSYTW